MKAIITVIGKDTTGIIAAVCTLLAERKINILDISQTVMEGFFTMTMLVDLTESTAAFADVSDALNAKGEEMGLVIRIQREDIFDKMRAKAWRPIYLPQMILHHIIPQKKLEQDYFDRLTLQMGKSERQRTLAISKSKYATRLLKEGIKWGGTIVLWFYFLLIWQPQKGNKLISFRANVTRGLLGIISES